MPIEMNRINRECPECKNSTLFIVNGKSYFCGKCLTEFSQDMGIKSKTVLESESAKIIRDSPETVEEIKVLQEELQPTQEVATEIMLDPELMIQDQPKTV